MFVEDVDADLALAAIGVMGVNLRGCKHVVNFCEILTDIKCHVTKSVT